MEMSDAVTRGKNPIGIIAWGPGNAIGGKNSRSLLPVS